MHATITMQSMRQGLNVYTQKPLTQTRYEARQLARVAGEKKLVTQMGIQLHSHQVHGTVVAATPGAAIEKVQDVCSCSAKHGGDRAPQPDPEVTPPPGLDR